MKQQLIDRNECIAQINKEIEKMERLYAEEKMDVTGLIISRTEARRIRSEIVAKMPIVEERDI